jgi:hypothetical protein
MLLISKCGYISLPIIGEEGIITFKMNRGRCFKKYDKLNI